MIWGSKESSYLIANLNAPHPPRLFDTFRVSELRHDDARALGSSRRRASVALRPPRPGMHMSVTTQSGRSVPNNLTTSSPELVSRFVTPGPSNNRRTPPQRGVVIHDQEFRGATFDMPRDCGTGHAPVIGANTQIRLRVNTYIICAPNLDVSYSTTRNAPQKFCQGGNSSLELVGKTNARTQKHDGVIAV